jgi:hypothetical protein
MTEPVQREQGFGPSWLLLPYQTLRSWFFRAGAAAACAIALLRMGAVAAAVQARMPESLALSFGDWYYESFLPNWAGWFAVAACAMALAVVRAAVIFATSSYVFKDDRVVLNFGLLNPDSPGGLLRIYRDAIPLAMIYDADTIQRIGERPWDSGSIILETVDKKSYCIPHVRELHQSAAALLAKAKISNMRIMGTV